MEEGNESYDVIEGLSGALTDVIDAETGQRGFLLTGHPEYLQSYENATRRMPQDLARLEELVRNDPVQFERFLAFRVSVEAKLTELQQTLGAYHSSGQQAALSIVTTDRGRRLMDEIRRVAASIRTRRSAI